MSDQNPYAAPRSDFLTETFEPPGEHDYASRTRRFFGSLIDGLIVVVPIMVVFFALGMFDETGEVEGIGGLFLGDDLLSEVAGSALFFVLTLVIQGYFWHTRSQSIGKICTRTKIVNLDGSPSTFASIAFKRTLILQLLITIPVVGQVISLVNALLIFRKEHNCLHDDIAKTRVVNAE